MREFNVKSLTDVDKQYKVWLDGNKFMCSCPHYQMRLAPENRKLVNKQYVCKHIIKVQYHLDSKGDTHELQRISNQGWTYIRR
jgi:hypothetical protein